MGKSTRDKAELIKSTETVIVFKASRPMDDGEHKQLSEKLRFEEEKSGTKIVLMPYSCELVEIQQNKTDSKSKEKKE